MYHNFYIRIFLNQQITKKKKKTHTQKKPSRHLEMDKLHRLQLFCRATQVDHVQERA